MVNAARILAARHKSKVAQENMDVFRDAWINQVRILTDAVDDITTIDDFLAVSENHILEDVNACVTACQTKDLEGLDRTANAIRGRCGRICSVVTAEMDNFEPGYYTERVLDSIDLLTRTVLPNFAEKVESGLSLINSGRQTPPDEKDFIDSARLVYEGVREIRRTVLLNRNSMEFDSDEYADIDTDLASSTLNSRPESAALPLPVEDEFPGISGVTTAREAMKKMPEQDRAKIAEQVEVFRVEKRKFDIEVSKWDDNGNDVIVLAKHMCLIMMEMTDFTRGKGWIFYIFLQFSFLNVEIFSGPLRTTMDVIDAARKISEAGTKLDDLARKIADQCAESTTKKDLLAYLERITLYCHQLNITSRVRYSQKSPKLQRLTM